MKVRILTASDYASAVIGFIKKVKTSYPMPTDMAMKNYYFSDDEPLYKAFGIFDEFDILYAVTMTQYSDYNRSWVLQFAAKQDFSNFDIMVKLLRETFNHAEQCGYYRMSAMFFNERFKTWERLLKKDEKFSRYISYTEEVIPVHQKSSFYGYWNFLQKRVTYPKEATIREYILKDEFRNSKDYK
ncbi:MAG TPA: hypothetical protein VIS28_06090 [Nitrososphaeraceae archaeon]